MSSSPSTTPKIVVPAVLGRVLCDSLDPPVATSLGITLTGIDECICQWRAARHQGEDVLTSLSNTLLLRTYIDKGRNVTNTSTNIDLGGANNANVWGALAGAGDTVARVSLASEARARRLHSELAALQGAMLAATRGIRRHAEDARRSCYTLVTGATRAGGDRARAGAKTGAGRDKLSRGDLQPAMHITAGVISPSMSKENDYTMRGNALRVGVTSAEEQHSFGIGGGYDVGDVADCAAEVSEMFMKEALVTATVIQGIEDMVAKGDREALTMYAAAWQMQPYVDARRVKELQTMVAGRVGDGGGARQSRR